MQIIGCYKNVEHMNHKYVIFTVFILVALVQLYVPAQTVFELENTLSTGKTYKFKTAPIDPNDPFRGKYITLRYAENEISVSKAMEVEKGDEIYLSLAEDEGGFAKVLSTQKKQPSTNQDFIKAKVGYYFYGEDSTKIIHIDYPFNRFYMEESKAYDAEIMARRVQRSQSDSVTYALVAVNKSGNAVLKDVLINGVPIQKMVENQQREVQK